MRLVDGEVRIFAPLQAVKHAQKLVRHYIPQGRLLSHEPQAKAEGLAVRRVPLQ